MSLSTQARSELADFLKSRRQQLDPTTVGLPSSTPRRTPGLRREEVSLLSGVSLTWYTWLEQKRDINPSRQVIDALARTLNLSPAEHQYVLHLSGHAAGPAPDESSVTLPDHGQRLLDSLGTSPAYAMTYDWTIVAWNSPYEKFYPNVATTPRSRRNLLWLVFTDPYVRSLLEDWDNDSRRFLTQFRAEAGPRVHEPAIGILVQRLQEVSEPFRHYWARHDVDRFASRERRFRHPTVGPLALEHHRLALSDCPDLTLVIYTPVADTGTAERLNELTGAFDR
ncbi:MAG: helix-turn-helix transcriptional regulator [Chloroflexota bacterium]|nr:helix-turn-helix transcriptional regulator [Chloroflexota bacterium]